MPQPKNHLLRLLVPTIVIVVGIGVAWAVLKSTKPSQTTPAAGTTQPTGASATSAPSAAPAPSGATAPTEAASAQPSSAAAPALVPAPSPTAANGSYHVVPVVAPAVIPSVGDIDPKGQYKAQVDFSTAGAGVKAIQLTEHYTSIRKERHEEVQSEHAVPHVGAPPDVLIPFAALAIEITPPGRTPVIVALAGANVWAPSVDHPGRFEATIADDAGTAVLRLTRDYTLAPKSLDIVLSQQVVNVSKDPLTVKWYEAGPVDLPQDAMGYGGDKRRVRFGYLLPQSKDPSRSHVLSNDYLMPRGEALGKREGNGYAERILWPNDKSKENQYDLVWMGMTNRYFGVAAYPIIDPAAVGPSKAYDWVDTITRIVLDGGAGSEVMAVRLESKPRMLAGAGTAGATADFTHGIYAGPLNRREIEKDPLLDVLGLTGLVVYNFGGPCAFCTFAPICDLLLWILHTLHDKIFQDWSMSIIFLVLIVRTCLHPVTKWSQIRMARFGKQMGGIAPKQKILQEKYKDDPKKLQEETGKLWREEGISPAGFLGCLPMVLQMPVWIALYATLYFSVEMRNYPAFYAIFQKIQPDTWKTWQFLGNLAEPDRLLYFGDKAIATLPLLGPITSLNILPFVLAVVFFIQQKYLTPPTAATLTPEQEFQQKLMRWMTVFMFPVFMYNAPSGLAIYFICNSTFAILESKYVRSHMDKYDMLNVEKMREQRLAKKSGKQAGFMARLQEMAEARQQEARKRAGLPPGKGPKRRP